MLGKKILGLGALIIALSINANAYTQKTHTGLDKVVKIIKTDKGLKKKTTFKQRVIAIESAKKMNRILVHSINRTGVARDGHISARDVQRLNKYIVRNYERRWKKLHGDDKKKRINGKKRKVETGFHLVQKNGSRTKMYGKNALNNVFDSIYHIGFRTDKKHRLVNEDGKRNKKFKKIAHYLNKVLARDLRRARIA